MGSKQNVIDCVVTEVWCDDVEEYTPEEIEDLCCKEQPIDRCAKYGMKIEPWDKLEDEELPAHVQELINEAKTNPCFEVTFDSRGGIPCGLKETQYKRTGTCCSYPPEFFWGSGPSVVNYDGEYIYTAYEKSQPYSFGTVGNGLSIVKLDPKTARLTIDDCFCDPGIVTATDVCGQTIIRLVSLSGGTWTSVTPYSVGSNYGWAQDGDPLHITIHGISENRKTHSLQSFGSVGGNSKESVCASALARNDYQTASPVAVPALIDGYQQCEGGGNIWWKDVTGDPRHSHNFHAYYANTRLRATYEWTYDSCEFDEFLYDESGSSSTIANDSLAFIVWDGGSPPFNVSVSGKDVWLDAEHTITQLEVGGQGVTIYSGTTCGHITVDVSDACGGGVSGGLRATSGYWYEHARVYHGASSVCPQQCYSDDHRWNWGQNWCSSNYPSGACDECNGPGGGTFCNPADAGYPANVDIAEGYSIEEWICVGDEPDPS